MNEVQEDVDGAVLASGWTGLTARLGSMWLTSIDFRRWPHSSASKETFMQKQKTKTKPKSELPVVETLSWSYWRRLRPLSGKFSVAEGGERDGQGG